jgi:hypothetical protein
MLAELDLNQADASDLDYAVQTNHSRSRTMKANVGSTDRIIRIVLGLIPLATAFMRWCPAYLPFGISTCKTE